MGPSGSGKTTFCWYMPQSLADKNDGDEFGNAYHMAMDNHLNIHINYKDLLLEIELEHVKYSLSLRILYQLLRSIFSFFLDYPESKLFICKWISGPKVTLSNTLMFIENQIGMTVGTARGILFVHLDKINSFLQDKGLSGVAFFTTMICLVTNSHQSCHKLFLAAISETMSAKMVQAAVKSEEPLYIIDLEQLTAIDYVECLESFLDHKFDHGRNPIWRLFDTIEGVPKLFAAVLCFLLTPDSFNVYPKCFKEWPINQDMIRFNIEDTFRTFRCVGAILDALWLYSYVMTDEPVSQTSHPFTHQTGSPYQKYTVADLEKDGFLFLAMLPAGTPSCHTYRITLPFFFLQMVSTAANSPVPHILATHDPTLYWQQAEHMDPNGILVKLFAYQQMGKAYVSTSALLPPNCA
ncbi:hypothetical protein PILCRDRAFT_83397 [Piloderma croceum F 1598]|uniref:Uncharacterized protein n=1 Tax=Piloderma croceum (strain F 1598) TaxID=765440 RepID=A0A0C3GKF6_PILCF|nr:hypothetical protein PILCRDRAFT_83397 [Piloderma croceum F 1598]